MKFKADFTDSEVGILLTSLLNREASLERSIRSNFENVIIKTAYEVELNSTVAVRMKIASGGV